MSDVGEYEQVVPEIKVHVERYLEAFRSVNTTYSGRPVDEVLSALKTAFESVGIEVSSAAAADAARMISERRVPG